LVYSGTKNPSKNNEPIFYTAEKPAEFPGGTRGGPLAPQSWGVTTQDAKHIYVHLFKQRNQSGLFIPGNFKAKKVSLMGSNTSLPFNIRNNGVLIDTKGIELKGPDAIISIELAP